MGISYLRGIVSDISGKRKKRITKRFNLKSGIIVVVR